MRRELLLDTDEIDRSDLALWREPMSYLVFSSATVMDVMNGTVLALNLIGSCFLTWSNEHPLKFYNNDGHEEWHSVDVESDWILLSDVVNEFIFSLALWRWLTWRTTQCWLWIWLDPALWREPLSVLVFSSATVMDVKNDTMLAVSTSLHGCQLLAGIIGK